MLEYIKKGILSLSIDPRGVDMAKGYLVKDWLRDVLRVITKGNIRTLGCQGEWKTLSIGNG